MQSGEASSVHPVLDRDLDSEHQNFQEHLDKVMSGTDIPLESELPTAQGLFNDILENTSIREIQRIFVSFEQYTQDYLEQIQNIYPNIKSDIDILRELNVVPVTNSDWLELGRSLHGLQTETLRDRCLALYQEELIQQLSSRELNRQGILFESVHELGEFLKQALPGYTFVVRYAEQPEEIVRLPVEEIIPMLGALQQEALRVWVDRDQRKQNEQTWQGFVSRLVLTNPTNEQISYPFASAVKTVEGTLAMPKIDSGLYSLVQAALAREVYTQLVVKLESSKTLVDFSSIVDDLAHVAATSDGIPESALAFSLNAADVDQKKLQFLSLVRAEINSEGKKKILGFFNTNKLKPHDELKSLISKSVQFTEPKVLDHLLDLLEKEQK